MSNKVLSKRLHTAAMFVSAGSIIADIGTDHAYLPIHLIKSGRCPKAIACDVKEKPLQAARKNVLANGLDSKIELRLGDGLQVLRPGEVQTAIIAGMGGNTIKQILKQSPEVLNGLEQLILQPMGDEESLRYWLITNGWRLADETLVLEDGRLYTVMACEHGEEQLHSSVILEIGPRLIEKKHPLLPRLLNKIEDKYRLILQGLLQSNKPEIQEKIKTVEKRLAALKKVSDQWL